MTKEEIIKLARKAGFADGLAEFIGLSAFDRFAALVADAEREKVAAWMIHRGYATGHGDTTEDLLKELDWQVLANWSSAMKTGAENEREAFPRLKYVIDWLENGCDPKEAAKELRLHEAAIRARKQTP